MLQTVLVDRFKLVARRDSRPLDAYALVLARKDEGWPTISVPRP